MTLKISVVLPTYNRSKSLVEAARSVLSQSIVDIELIIVDDCSTEDIEDVVRSLNDTRVKYVRHDRNMGAAAARNTGLTYARGELIAFQDSDDLWLPNKLKMQMDILLGLPEDVGAVTGAKILYGMDKDYLIAEGKVCLSPPPEGCLTLAEDQVLHLFGENRISLQNALFRKTCYPQSTWFDPCAKANNDWEFAVRLAQHTKIFEDIRPVVLGFYSVDSISAGFRRKSLGILRILKKNKPALMKYKKQHSSLLFRLGRILHGSGKRTWGRKLILASIRQYPLSSLNLAASLFRALLKKIKI